MPARATYAFPDFVTDLELITQVETDQAEIIRKISRKMQLLISTQDFLTDEEQRPDPGHYARHLVHLDRSRRFVFLSGVWLPGQGTPVHDHGTWGIMGIAKGELRVTNYVRLDDRATPGRATLREAAGCWCGPGSVSYVLPPNEEIHKVENAGASPALSIHVYGRDVIECNRFDVERGTMEPYVQNSAAR
jgi:predicted metal-dependent enzyme (double-stranded beta helix superfamily)